MAIFYHYLSYNEVDLLEQIGDKQYAYEIKSGSTYSAEYFKGLRYWATYSKAESQQ